MEAAVNSLSFAAMGGDAPADDAAEGDAEAPAEGDAAPAEGDAAPAEGDAAPAEGDAAAAEGDAAAKPAAEEEEAVAQTDLTEDEVKEFWKDIKDWKKEHIQYAILDVKEGDFSDLEKELVAPYFTGVEDRSIPAIFVVRGEKAYLVTGPKPLDGLKKAIKLLGDRKLR